MNQLIEFLFCPSHGLLRFLPLLVPMMLGVGVTIKTQCYKVQNFWTNHIGNKRRSG